MRLAVDTNVLVRAVVDDGSEQARLSQRCFVTHEIYVGDTVLLETEWLLRSRFQLARARVNGILTRLLLTSNVRFESRMKIEMAVQAHAEGMDFADALHLLAAENCDALVTFDEDFIKRRALISNAIPVRNP